MECGNLAIEYFTLYSITLYNIKQSDNMKKMNNNTHVLMAKYIDNQTTERESLCFLKLLSQSLELREVFSLAVSGNEKMQKISNNRLTRI